MSTFIEAVMALREAGFAMLDCTAYRDIPHLPGLPAAFERLREAVHSPELSDDALHAQDEDRARELAPVELEAPMAERRAILAVLRDPWRLMRYGDWKALTTYFEEGRHIQGKQTPIIEPGPACSERGEECCR